MTGRVAILADDLSGALDTAAAFATPRASIPVFWNPHAAPAAGSFALDSETRDVGSSDARTKVLDHLPEALKRQIVYKKINSQLRGNTVAEIAACTDSGHFGSVVVAPAFPAQNRITRGGTQFVATEAGWVPLYPSLLDSLQQCTSAPRSIGRGEPITGGGVFVCDAEDEHDLATIAHSASALDEPVLWCGSAGLGRALAGPPATVALPDALPVLAVTASRHPVSLAQFDRLASAAPETVVEIASPASTAIAKAARGLARHNRAALRFNMPETDRASASAFVQATCDELVRTVVQPGLLIVAGGDTLMHLVRALGATRLDTLGEWRPGIALSRMPDGLWGGTSVLSKSGAFGDERMLLDIFGMTMERSR